MKTLSLVFSTILLLASCALGQTFQCSAPVNDLANVLQPQMSAVQQAAYSLAQKDATVRLVTLRTNGQPMDLVVKSLVQQCPEMQSANGGIKTNLILIGIAPFDHAFGIYTGTAYEDAFGGARMDKYRGDFMKPHLKAHEWAESLIAPAQQMSERLTAWKSEANAPVVNQATDFKGLWFFFYILAGMTFLGMAWWAFAKAKQHKDSIGTAQADAIAARDNVTSKLTDIENRLRGYLDKKTSSYYQRADSIIDSVSSRYAVYAQSISGDPTVNGGSLSIYLSLAKQYGAMADKLTEANGTLDLLDSAPHHYAITSVAAATPVKSTDNPFLHKKHKPVKVEKEEQAEREDTRPEVEVSHDGSDLATGILVGSMLGREEQPSYHEPDPEPEPERSEPEDTFSKSSASSTFDNDEKSSFSSDSGSVDFGTPSGGADFSTGSGSDTF